MCGIINNGNQDKIFPKPLTQKSSILQSVFSYIVQLGLWFLHATYVTYVHIKSSLLCKVFRAPLLPQSSFGMIFVHSVFLDFLHLKLNLTVQNYYWIGIVRLTKSHLVWKYKLFSDLILSSIAIHAWLVQVIIL